MNDKYPWMQFYVSEWMSDPCLSKCGPATRGIWIDLVCSMHLDNRCGQITGTVESLARICRCSIAEMDHAVHELDVTKTADVTFCNTDVTLVNRRMQRAFFERRNANERVKKHRMKRECNTTEVRNQKSEVRNQSKTGTPRSPNGALSESELRRQQEYLASIVADEPTPVMAKPAVTMHRELLRETAKALAACVHKHTGRLVTPNDAEFSDWCKVLAEHAGSDEKVSGEWLSAAGAMARTLTERDLPRGVTFTDAKSFTWAWAKLHKAFPHVIEDDRRRQKGAAYARQMAEARAAGLLIEPPTA